MESPQVVGGAEECSSSESGWTMYLASPMHDDDEAEIEEEEEAAAAADEEDGEDEGDVETDDDEEDDQGADGGDEEDGDSLASDASSGPPHRGLSRKNGCAGGDVVPTQPGGDEEDGAVSRGYSWKKAHKGVVKKRDGSGAAASRMEAGAASLSCSSDKEVNEGFE